MNWRCWFRHKWGKPSVLESLGVWFVQCARCGQMMKVARSRDDIRESPE